MAGIRPRFERGSPLTFNANENIRGGQMVEVDGDTGRIKVTDGASDRCLGVALGDASAPGFVAGSTTDAWGNPTVNHGLNPPNEVAVANQGVYDLTATNAAIPFGALVTSAADGKVAAAGTTPGAGTVIGRCVEATGTPAGIPANGTGKILLTGVGA